MLCFNHTRGGRSRPKRNLKLSSGDPALTPIRSPRTLEYDHGVSPLVMDDPSFHCVLIVTCVQSHPWPWPKAPWTYIIPGHSPQHLLFEEISSENTGLEGQQSTLHACDEIVRWLWENYKEDQIVEHACMQKISFNGRTKGSVVMVFVPITKTDVIDRELALDGMRSLENLVWRYGGQSLECEIWSGGKVKGRISIVIKVFKENSIAGSDTVAATSRM